jgi:hypothetical protein
MAKALFSTLVDIFKGGLQYAINGILGDMREKALEELKEEQEIEN